MTVLVVAALVILWCSFQKQPDDGSNNLDDVYLSSFSSSVDDLKTDLPTITAMDVEPKTVVIMAGEDTPSFLAKKLPFGMV